VNLTLLFAHHNQISNIVFKVCVPITVVVIWTGFFLLTTRYPTSVLYQGW